MTPKADSIDARSRGGATRSSNEVVVNDDGAKGSRHRVRRSCRPREREERGQMTKPFVIPNQLVWEAFQRLDDGNRMS